ncbi:MAG: glycosyltransferase family 2 protein [Candidatus Brocadiales bacterium]|nr:glycosyltransferase family 2 protein [Candidatus Brocadiales bacterium]
MSKISVLILAQNSQKMLPRALESVSSFDEVVVVDGGSEDKTKEIVESFNAKYILNEFKSFSDQRNFLLKQSSNDWSFFVDSDEFVTKELQTELYRLIKCDKTHPLYRVMRTEYLQGQQMLFSNSRSCYQERFFKTDRVRYVGELHEHPLIDNEKLTFNSQNSHNIDPKFRLLHDPHVGAMDIIKKMPKYVELKAYEKIAAGNKMSAFVIILNLVANFFQIWFRTRTYKDGWRGVVVTVLESINRTLVRLLIYEQQNLKKESIKK